MDFLIIISCHICPIMQYFYHVTCCLHCFFFSGDEVGWHVVAEVHSFEGSGRILVVRIMKSGILMIS